MTIINIFLFEGEGQPYSSEYRPDQTFLYLGVLASSSLGQSSRNQGQTGTVGIKNWEPKVGGSLAKNSQDLLPEDLISFLTLL